MPAARIDPPVRNRYILAPGRESERPGRGCPRMSFFPRDLARPTAAPGPILQWEEPDCLLCGARNWAALVEGADKGPGGTGLWFAVVQCQECGLCFTNPRPAPFSIGRFYPKEYRPHQSPRPTDGRRWRVRRHAGKLLTELDLPKWHGQGRLLDFGCGGGSFLQRMHARGWQVTGVDV